MSEAIYNVVQLGRQSAIGTGVAATTKFPVDAGFLGFELDRSAESPDEDMGSTSREQAGRETFGNRWATASLPFVGRFEDLFHAFELHVSKVAAPTGSYVYAYPFDESGSLLSSVLKPYTCEYGVYGSTQDQWRAIGVLADSLDFGFDALSGPGNSMWKGSLGLVALNREYHALTTVAGTPPTLLAAPTALETMEGHRTTFAEGDTSTAFGSLAPLTASLKQYGFRSGIGAKGRFYAGSDTASDVGRSGKGTVEFDALVAIGATAKSDIQDVYEQAATVATERRWRLTVDGDGVNSLVIDARVKFRAVNVGDHDGERLYAVKGVWVKDSDLAGRGKFTLTNAVASIP